MRPQPHPFTPADVLDRVHHHRWNPVPGTRQTGFCGTTVMAMTADHASELPCCPMCALVLDERGWSCIAEEAA